MVTVSFTGMVSSTFLICWLEYYFTGAGHYNLVSSTCAFLLLSYLRSILDFSDLVQESFSTCNVQNFCLIPSFYYLFQEI